MKKQQQRNDSIKTKLDKIMYSMEKLGVQDDARIEDKASKVKAKDLPDTSECQMQDPFSVECMENADWDDCPWSASELEAFYENAIQELPLEKDHQLMTLDDAMRAPAILKKEEKADLSLDFSRSGSSECSQKRYSTDPTIVVMCGVTSKVCEIYRMPGEMSHLHSIFLETEPYILNFEQVDFSPKSTWSLVCLEVDSAKGNFNSRLCFNFGLWFNYDEVMGQQRLPWPPPIQSQLWSVDVKLRPTPWPPFVSHTVGTVFLWWDTRVCDVHKDEDIGSHKTTVIDLMPATLLDTGQGTYILHFVTVGISPKLPWLLHKLDDNSSMDNFATLMSCTQPLVLTDSAQLRPPPWPLINNSKLEVCSSASLWSMVQHLFAISKVGGCYSVALKWGMQVKLVASMLLWNQYSTLLSCALSVNNQFLYWGCCYAKTKYELFREVGCHNAEVSLKEILSVILAACTSPGHEQLPEHHDFLSICRAVKWSAAGPTLSCASQVLLQWLESWLFISYMLIMGSPVNHIFGDTCTWSSQHWLEGAVKYCWMQWDIYWPAFTTLHQEKDELVVVTEPMLQSLLQLENLTLVSKHKLELIQFKISSQKVWVGPLHVQCVQLIETEIWLLLPWGIQTSKMTMPISDSLLEWPELYVTILPFVGFLSKETNVWMQLTRGASGSAPEACKRSHKWLMVVFLQSPFRSVHSVSSPSNTLAPCWNSNMSAHWNCSATAQVLSKTTLVLWEIDCLKREPQHTVRRIDEMTKFAKVQTLLFMQKKYGDRLSATRILSIWLDCNLNLKCVLAKLSVRVCLLNAALHFSHMYYIELKPWPPPQLDDIGYAPRHATYTNLLYNVISNLMHVEDTTYLSFLVAQQESIKQGKIGGIFSSPELELVFKVQTQCCEDAKLMKLFPEITFQGQFKNDSKLEGLIKMSDLKINLALIPLSSSIVKQQWSYACAKQWSYACVSDISFMSSTFAVKTRLVDIKGFDITFGADWIYMHSLVLITTLSVDPQALLNFTLANGLLRYKGKLFTRSSCNLRLQLLSTIWQNIFSGSVWGYFTAVHCVNLMAMVFVNSVTTVHVVGICQMNCSLICEIIFTCSGLWFQFFENALLAVYWSCVGCQFLTVMSQSCGNSCEKAPARSKYQTDKGIPHSF